MYIVIVFISNKWVVKTAENNSQSVMILIGIIGNEKGLKLEVGFKYENKNSRFV